MWTAPRGFSRTAFLTIKYSIPVILSLQAWTMSGIDHAGLSLEFCKPWFSIVFILGLISLSSGNLLIIVKVRTLWDKREI